MKYFQDLRYNILILLIFGILAKDVKCFYITVDAQAEECFFERIVTGTKLGLIFEVVDGGFLDIDIVIKGPDNKVIHKEERSSTGKITFSAHMDGTYSYCFGNKMSTMTPKDILFNIEIGEVPNLGELNQEKNVSHNKLEEMIKELSGYLKGIKNEKEYMAVRDKIHRQINESTNSRVVLWAVFEALILLVMTLGQVFYLKRFFEVRRVI